MKLSTRDAQAFLKSPNPGTALVLLYGPDAMRTAITRQDFMITLLGENAEEDMRLTRLSASEALAEPPVIQDAVKAIGFFPGPRGVLITEANDRLAPILTEALSEWQDGDATLVIEAGNLRKTSALRKLAEKDPRAAAIALYPDPLSRPQVEDLLAQAGLKNAQADAITALLGLGAQLDPGDFRQLIEKIALYTLSSDEPLTVTDIEACAPATTEEGIDDTINALADGDVAGIGVHLQRLAAQGTNPTTLCIAASRHFRQLHSAAADQRGGDAGLSGLRPPVFGARRDRMSRQIRTWGMHRLETALHVLLETDARLRSTTSHPAMAMTERAFIRIAMLARAGQG